MILMRPHDLRDTPGIAARSLEQGPILSRRVRHVVEVRQIIRRTDDPGLQHTLQQLLKQRMGTMLRRGELHVQVGAGF